jgi:hypothetical protein
MIEMRPLAQQSALAIEFNAFLFAPVRGDRALSDLSVVSALARLGLDPWTAAADLARLPAEAAEQKLASLLARLPEAGPADSDFLAISADLVRLLPVRQHQQAPRTDLAPPGLINARSNFAAFTFAITAVAYLVIMALVTDHNRAGPPQPANVQSSQNVAAQDGLATTQTP